MDILYVVGRGSRRDNLELRMSLRSICKYAANVGRIVVAGYPPPWLSDEAIKVEFPDLYRYKHSNILRCIEEVVDKEVLCGEFLYSSDDHFYIRKVDFDNYPVYQKPIPLKSKVERWDEFYKYHKSLYDTRQLLIKHNLPTDNYAQHCNTHMHTDVIRDIIDIIHESYALSYGVEPTTVVMNAWMTYPLHPKPVPRDDVKITSAISMTELWEKIGNRDCFSIGDSLFGGDAIGNLFASEFPNKCIYEK